MRERYCKMEVGKKTWSIFSTWIKLSKSTPEPGECTTLCENCTALALELELELELT